MFYYKTYNNNCIIRYRFGPLELGSLPCGRVLVCNATQTAALTNLMVSSERTQSSVFSGEEGTGGGEGGGRDWEEGGTRQTWNKDEGKIRGERGVPETGSRWRREPDRRWLYLIAQKLFNKHRWNVGWTSRGGRLYQDECVREDRVSHGACPTATCVSGTWMKTIFLTCMWKAN
jgi:hypothetical protein